MKRTGDCMPAGVVTVLENQIDAEHKNEDRHGESRCLRNKQTIFAIIIALVACILIVSCTSAFHWYASDHSVGELNRKIAILESQNKWLWKSHLVSKALKTDDESLLIKKETWDYALENWPKAEIRWVKSIIEKGDNPNLAKHLNIQVVTNKWETRRAKEKAHQRNKLKFIFACFWDCKEEFADVDLTKLPQNWTPLYRPLISRLEETNSTNILAILNGSEIDQKHVVDANASEQWFKNRYGAEHPLGGSL